MAPPLGSRVAEPGGFLLQPKASILMNITPMDRIECDAIERHLLILMDACNSALANLRKIEPAKRGKLIEGQIIYWKNARGAFKWAIKIAKQRTYGNERGIRSPIQQLRTDTIDGG